MIVRALTAIFLKFIFPPLERKEDPTVRVIKQYTEEIFNNKKKASAG